MPSVSSGFHMVEESVREIPSPLLPLQRQFPVPSSRSLFVMYNNVRRHEMVILLFGYFKTLYQLTARLLPSVIWRITLPKFRFVVTKVSLIMPEFWRSPSLSFGDTRSYLVLTVCPFCMWLIRYKIICNANITVYIYIHTYIYVCVCVCARAHTHTHTHTQRGDPCATHTTHFSTADFLFYKYPFVNILLR